MEGIGFLILILFATIGLPMMIAGLLGGSGSHRAGPPGGKWL